MPASFSSPTAPSAVTRVVARPGGRCSVVAAAGFPLLDVQRRDDCEGKREGALAFRFQQLGLSHKRRPVEPQKRDKIARLFVGDASFMD